MQNLIELWNGVQMHAGENELKSREPKYVEARFMFFALARERGYTIKSIGSVVGKNHATVVHGLAKHQDYIDTDQKYDAKFSEISSKLTHKTKTSESKAKAEIKLLLKRRRDINKQIKMLRDSFIRLT